MIIDKTIKSPNFLHARLQMFHPSTVIRLFITSISHKKKMLMLVLSLIVIMVFIIIEQVLYLWTHPSCAVFWRSC